MAILPVKPKKSSVSGKIPSPDQLDIGELAINVAKGSEGLYTKNSNNEIVELGNKGDGGSTEDGSTIKLTGYTIATGSTEEELTPVPSDSINQGLGKLHKAILDNELVSAKMGVDLNERVEKNKQLALSIDDKKLTRYSVNSKDELTHLTNVELGDYSLVKSEKNIYSLVSEPSSDINNWRVLTSSSQPSSDSKIVVFNPVISLSGSLHEVRMEDYELLMTSIVSSDNKDKIILVNSNISSYGEGGKSNYVSASVKYFERLFYINYIDSGDDSSGEEATEPYLYSMKIDDGLTISLLSKIKLSDLNKVLTKDNTSEYTPSQDYNPATKKYVDTYSYGKVINVSVGSYLTINKNVKGTDAINSINSIFGSVDSLKSVINDILSNHTRYYFHSYNSNMNCIELSSIYAFYEKTTEEYNLQCNISYFTNNGHVSKRLGFKLLGNNDSGAVAIIEDLVVSDNINRVTRKTSSEYNSLTPLDDTMYAIIN